MATDTISISDDGTINETIPVDPIIKSYKIDELAVELEEARLREAGAIAARQTLEDKYNDLLSQVDAKLAEVASQGG